MFTRVLLLVVSLRSCVHQVVGIRRVLTKVGDAELGQIGMEFLTLRVVDKPLLALDKDFVWPSPQWDLEHNRVVNAAVIPSARARFSLRSVPLTAPVRPSVDAAHRPAPVAGDVHWAVQLSMQGLTCHLDRNFGRVVAVSATTIKVGWWTSFGKARRGVEGRGAIH